MQQQPGHTALFMGALSTSSPPTATFQDVSDNVSSDGSLVKDDAVADPLVNALAILAVPGIKGQPYLSLHAANSIKKCIWVGQFIGLAYLLETQSVREDFKPYEFACSNSANPNRLSLTASKPRRKADSYTAWNKAFRVYIEIISLNGQTNVFPWASTVQTSMTVLENSHLVPPILMTLSSAFNVKLILHFHGMKLTTGCGLNVLLVEQERATLPVPPFIPV